MSFHQINEIHVDKFLCASTVYYPFLAKLSLLVCFDVDENLLAPDGHIVREDVLILSYAGNKVLLIVRIAGRILELFQPLDDAIQRNLMHIKRENESRLSVNDSSNSYAPKYMFFNSSFVKIIVFDLFFLIVLPSFH